MPYIHGTYQYREEIFVCKDCYWQWMGEFDEPMCNYVGNRPRKKPYEWSECFKPKEQDVEEDDAVKWELYQEEWN